MVRTDFGRELCADREADGNQVDFNTYFPFFNAFKLIKK